MYYLKRKPKKAKEKEPKPKKPSVSALVKKLDRVFSEYIRLRDSRPFSYKMFRCISCGEIKPYDQADAGHFISRTHMSTRFDENNVHAECRFCNRFKADHMIGYQHNLIVKLGEQRYHLLLARGKETKKWSPWELELLIRHYTEEVKRMKDEKL